MSLSFKRALASNLNAAEVAALRAAISPVALNFHAVGVDFNDDNSDTVIPITLPEGYTRFIVTAVRISKASQTLTTATCGLFTEAAGGGTAIVTGASAISINTTNEGTNNNAQGFTVNNTATQSYRLADVPNLYFRVGTAQGAAATGNVMVTVTALP